MDKNTHITKEDLERGWCHLIDYEGSLVTYYTYPAVQKKVLEGLRSMSWRSSTTTVRLSTWTIRPRIGWSILFSGKANVTTRQVAISSADYAETFSIHGGSFACHPEVVSLLSSLANIPAEYAALVDEDNGPVGAVPHWGRVVGVTHAALYSHDAVGHSSILATRKSFFLSRHRSEIHFPFEASFISEITARGITNSCRAAFNFMFAKSLLSQDIHSVSTKFRKNRCQKPRKLMEQGARFVPVSAFSPKSWRRNTSFTKRWGFAPLGEKYFSVVFDRLGDLLCGDVLIIGEQPIVVEILYKVAGPRCMCVNYADANSGVDPDYRSYSPGSILLFHNIAQVEAEAATGGKELRFCCGRDDAPYKRAWCSESPAFDVILTTR